MKRVKLSNCLTLIRLLSIIPIIYLLFSDLLFAKTGAFLLYLGTLITDHFDGSIARKRNEISQFGRFFDPLSDKIVTLSIFISLVALQMVPVWIVIIIVSREFVITCLALIIQSKSDTVKFSKGRNFKSLSQIVVVALILFILSLNEFMEFMDPSLVVKTAYCSALSINMLVWFAMFLAVLSGYFFMVRNNIKIILKDV